MNQEVKAKWVAALRSGEFKQGKDALRQGDEFCCLGVLSELAVQDGVIESAEKLDPANWRAGGQDGVYAYGTETGHLPCEVAEWAGLTYYDPFDEQTYPEPDPAVGDSTLAEMNDRGATFIELAAIIEKEL